MKASSWSGSSSTSIGAGDAARALLVDRGDPGMLLVGRPVDVLGLRLEVALEDLGDVEAAERLALVARDLDGVALGDIEVGRQGDRDRPVLAVREGHVLDDALPVLGALRAREGGEAAVADHLEVGGLAIGQLQLEWRSVSWDSGDGWKVDRVGQEAAAG